jgi:branched-chain amino acid transport system ATP-binding protein
MKPFPLLELTNIVAGYGKMRALNGISITINKGDIVTLLGSNGVGKTTTLRTILGQTNVESGEITFKGSSIKQLRTFDIAALGISYCPEGRQIFHNLSTKENLISGAYLVRSKQKLKDNLDRVYTLFPILKNRRNQISESLSGGEQEMLAIARSLMGNPELLLMDEPSLGIAPKLVELIFRTIERINDDGVSILLIEQNAKLALDTADYGYLMRKGTIALGGKASELANDERVKEIYLGIRSL